jgi:integrase
VRDLTTEQVAQWHLDVAARSTAIRMALSTLSGLMLYAEDHGLREAGSNPCRGLSKKWRGQRGQLLPATTIRALWVALDRLQTRMPDACDAVRLLLLTGARRSEILSLEWDWIVGSRAVLKDSKEGLARSGSTSLPAPFSMPGKAATQAHSCFPHRKGMARSRSSIGHGRQSEPRLVSAGCECMTCATTLHP